MFSDYESIDSRKITYDGNKSNYNYNNYYYINIYNCSYFLNHLIKF